MGRGGGGTVGEETPDVEQVPTVAAQRQHGEATPCTPVVVSLIIQWHINDVMFSHKFVLLILCNKCLILAHRNQSLYSFHCSANRCESGWK